MRDSSQKEKKHVCKQILQLFTSNVMEHNVGRSAAALAFYLLFALFPLLIFISNLLGLLDLDVASISLTLQKILPHDVVGIIEGYLEHVSQTSSKSLLGFSLVFTIWFPMRAIRGLMDSVRLAYRLEKPKRPLKYVLRQFVYTIVLLVAIVLALLLSVLGKRSIAFVSQLFPTGAEFISSHLLTIWQYLRFVPVAALMFAALGTLYAAALDKKQKMKAIWPGIFAALAAWLVISICFSFYVENFGSYSIIYGTLGTVIVLVMWLYITAFVLILGAELNAALLTIRTQDTAYENR